MFRSRIARSEIIKITVNLHRPTIVVAAAARSIFFFTTLNLFDFFLFFVAVLVRFRANADFLLRKVT